MPRFDPSTTSGNALASLFRVWCPLRGDDPDGEVDGCDMTQAIAEHFEALGLDVGGPAAQVDGPPAVTPPPRKRARPPADS